MAAYRPERAGRDADERGNMLNANSPRQPPLADHPISSGRR